MWPIATSPVQAAELLLLELREQAELAEHRQPPVLGDGDAGRLLATVLERVEREVRQRARRRDRARGCRRRRTSDDRARAPRAQAVELVDSRRRAPRGRTAVPRGRRDRRRPRSTVAASTSASSRPPSETSWTSEQCGRARQRNGQSSASARGRALRARRIARPRRPRASRAARAHVGTSPTQPTTGVGGIGAAVRLVVERDVAGDDRDAERLGRLRDPLDRLGRAPSRSRASRGCRS